MSHTVPPLASGVAEKCTSRGTRGVVSATAPEAAWVGRDAFLAGGNAFDAALAAALAETVLLPPKCGLAGDLVALCLRPGHPPRALVAVGPAPAALGDTVRRQGALPTTGGLAVGVPGAPAGYTALARLGALGLARAARPSADLANRGFSWSPVNDRYLRRSRELLEQQNPNGTAYLPRGRPIPVGSRVTVPGLAHVLDEFVRREADLFAGPIGDALVAAVHARGGVITAEDLSRAEARWEEPIRATVAGRRLCATPAPTHGPSLLGALAEAGAAADAVTLWKAVEGAVAARDRDVGDIHGDAGTSVITAADADGNAVVVVHSNSHPTFGSGIVLEPHALVLANRAGRGFSSEPGHPNFPHLRRRPVTTLHAWSLGPADGRPALMGATPGGESQMPWNAQVVQRLLRGASPADAILAPRWARGSGGALEIEEGFPAADRAALANAVATSDVPLWSLWSGMQVVTVGDSSEPLTVAADIRSTGGTAAY
ncbi:MAG: gamma-glutamyltransferase [Streptosporangiaceae bacterium]